ncbi:MAG: radical SAM protein [Treponema sp.]|nr:radical SAM protein [Treponema sp.]
MRLDNGNVKHQHPCFSGEAHLNRGRIHLPVSPACNIQCRFCKRSITKTGPERYEQRPGFSGELLRPEEALDVVRRALDLCPEITVVGIAGPGDTLATYHALETFDRIHQAYPELIKCLSTNGLLLEPYVDDLFRVGVRTLTVTVNGVYPGILEQICSQVIFQGVRYKGREGAALLIEAQKRGIRKAAARGILVKINIVLIPGINRDHIAEIARTVKTLGAGIINIIPLIPQQEPAAFTVAPDCTELSDARETAERYLPVFRHCQHCRADAAGIPGQPDLSPLLYEYQAWEQTFSHG